MTQTSPKEQSKLRKLEYKASIYTAENNIPAIMICILINLSIYLMWTMTSCLK